MQQGSRDQLKAPSRRSSPRQRKSAPGGRRKQAGSAAEKGCLQYSTARRKRKGVSPMSNTEIQSKVNELRELRRMADELTAEIESIQDAIKAHMTAIDADTLTGTDYKITWKTVTSSRFDSTAFKKAMPELAERFTKSSTSRRFTVA